MSTALGSWAEGQDKSVIHKSVGPRATVKECLIPLWGFLLGWVARDNLAPSVVAPWQTRLNSWCLGAG